VDLDVELRAQHRPDKESRAAREDKTFLITFESIDMDDRYWLKRSRKWGEAVKGINI
jgi:hypothetical protein